MEFPQDFTARERALLGARFDELYAYATPQPARGVTVNALRCTPEWFAQHADFDAKPSPFCPTAFTTAADFRPGRHAWHHAGVLYAQEPSASAPAALLDVQPGMRVADLCAAPGGKTSQLAAALQGQGLLLANEFVAARAEILRQNLERMGVTNAVITNEDTARLAAAMPGQFDRVLVDAPCSGEGMFRKEAVAAAQHNNALVAHCAELGTEILENAAALLAPGGVLVYASKPHSYRELPIRAGEIGLVHRHELRGALHGLFRVRCFNQDDAHLFVRPDQLTDEIVGVVNLIDSVYQKFGFKYHVELSTRPDDSMGSDEDWARAEEGLKAALTQLGMDYEVNEGDGAFYGPKIDFHLEDSLGRTWQCGTVQLDFQMPINFDLEYTDADGSKKRPIMLHRVCFGSIERFIGILIEHYAGKFPTWLAPVQVKVLPVSEKSRDYAHQVTARLEEAGIRVACDDRDEKIGYKIREARSTDRVPYMLILGEKEVEAGNISVRDRSNETVQRELDDFIADVKAEVAERRS